MGIQVSQVGVNLIFIAIYTASATMRASVFCGGCFEGFQNSPLGTAGTTRITSNVYAMTHKHYGTFKISEIVYRGIAKIKTASLYILISLPCNYFGPIIFFG